MTTRIAKGRALLFLLVPGIVVLDLANGLLGPGVGPGGLPITPGEMGRSLLLVASLLVLITLRGPYFRPLQRFFVLAVALGLLGPLHAFLSSGAIGGFAFDVENLSKSLYGPALIVLFTALFLRFRLTYREVVDAIALWGGIAGFGILLFKLLGIGQATYGEYAAAYKGLFLAQNDLGLGMIMALTACCHLLLSTRRPRYLVILAGTVIGMLILGTRASTLGAFVVPLAVFATHPPPVPTKRRALEYAFLGLAFLMGLALVAQTQVRSIASQSYQAEKFTSLLSGELTRVVLLGGALSYVEDRGPVSQLLGDGALRYQTGVAERLPLEGRRHMAEVDWMDLFGAHGLFFALAIYAFYILFLARTRDLASEEGPGARWTLRIMLGLYLLHATLAGHALGSPLPTGVIAPALAFTWLVHRRALLARRRQQPVAVLP